MTFMTKDVINLKSSLYTRFSRLIVLLLSVILVSNMIFADEINDKDSTSKDSKSKNKIVLGVYGGISMLSMYSEYEYRTSANALWQEIPGEYDSNLMGFSWGAKLGYDFYFLPSSVPTAQRHSLRLYADYMNTLLDSKDGTLGKGNMHTIGLNLDYKFDIIAGFGVFAGAGLIYNIFDTQHLGALNNIGGSLNIGVSWSVWLLEIEARVRYLMYETRERRSSFIPAEITAMANGASGNNIWHKVDFETPLSMHLGVNFRF